MLELIGHISSSTDFLDHPKVLVVAFDLFKNVLIEKSGHTRTVFEDPRLPKNAAIEWALLPKSDCSSLWQQSLAFLAKYLYFVTTCLHPLRILHHLQ
ncbi:hypothetical protein IID10_15960 [candidate division KSB1 bacterium]|nr:hypothetical protein [candidate division KSB1 bacterium]